MTKVGTGKMAKVIITRVFTSTIVLDRDLWGADTNEEIIEIETDPENAFMAFVESNVDEVNIHTKVQFID